MTTEMTATATIEVAVDPQRAFDAFTSQIGAWWRRGTPYWNQPERSVEMRFEPAGPGGRLVEVEDRATGAGMEIGRVREWRPGERLTFGWRQLGWGEGEQTEVDVRFEPTPSGGTRVTVSHAGWERVASAGAGMRDAYGHGWRELLGWFAEHAEAR